MRLYINTSHKHELVQTLIPRRMRSLLIITYRRGLLCDSARIFRTSRYFIRCSYPSPPFCFETPIDYELNNLLGFFVATCNRATGLPLPLDLTDQDITMPTGFTQEFVEEIEANLVKDPDLDKYEIANRLPH